MRLTKLANWLSNGDLEKYRLQAQQEQAKLPKMESELAKFRRDFQKSQKELAQAKAQLQINQGFQIELGETQQKLQQVQTEAQHYKQELFEQQKQFDLTQSQFQLIQQKLAKAQNWTQQLKTPIQITDIKKTLPKQDFETLWGFGIITPNVDFTITTGAILVKGWVLGKKAQAQTVRVKYQNESLLETPVQLRRPIVIQQYPDIPSASKSGFEFAVAVASIPAEIELSLEALLTDQTVVSLCDFRLKPLTIESNDTQSLI
ncbi:MAG: hypothetical protein ACFCU7_08275 [Pleurocapsa sp.]